MNKILVKDYLKQLNKEVDYLNQYREAIHVKKLTCKELAALIQVTPATITNLTTDSKYSLIKKITDEIYKNYYELFDHKTRSNIKDFANEVAESLSNISQGCIYYNATTVFTHLVELYID